MIAGWTVTALERRDGFARLTLRHDNDETQVEVNTSSGEGDWSTRFYRVQPAPGKNPSKELLRAILDDLRAWEQRPGHTPFLLSTPYQHGVFDPKDDGGGQTIIRLLFWVLLVMTALLTAATTWLRWKENPRGRRILIAAGVLIGASTITVFVFLPPKSIPADWVVTLKYGATRASIGRVFGRDVHTGPGYRFVMDLLAPGPGERMRGIVRTNLWLAAVNTVLFGCVARALAGGTWAAVILTLWFAGNWAFVNSASSELPSQLLTLLMLVGVMAAWRMERPLTRYSRSERPSRALRVLKMESGFFLLSLLTIWGWTIRAEFGLVGGLALLSAVRQRWKLLVVQPAEGASAELSLLTRWWFQSPLIRLIAVLAVYGAYRLLDVRLEAESRLLLAGLMPFDEGVFTLPLAMTLFFPPALVALMVIGCWHGNREGGAWLGLAIGLIFLHKLYVTADHHGFELFRRWTAMVPGAMLFAAVGWRRIAPPQQVWRNGLLAVLLLPWPWQRVLWPLSLALTHAAIWWGFALIFCWPEISLFLNRIFRVRFLSASSFPIAAWHWPFSLVLAGFLLWLPTQAPSEPYGRWKEQLLHPPGYRLVKNQIREVQFLVEALDRNPGAVFVTEVWRGSYESGGAEHDWTFFGSGLEAPLDVPKGALPLAQVIAESVPFARRVLLFRGLDCNLSGEQPCLDPPGKVLMKERFTSAPLTDQESALLSGTEVTLSVNEIAQ